MIAREAARDWYGRAFRRLEERLNGGADSDLHRLRRRGFEAFAARGFPTTSEEEWRFTNIAPIAGTPFAPVLERPTAPVRLPEAGALLAGEAHVLLVVNGHFAGVLPGSPPVPPGVRAGSLAAAMAEEPALAARLGALGAPEQDAFTALNTAFLLDGACIRVADGVALERPIQILSILEAASEPLLVQPRHLILAGRGARLTVIETYAGAAPTRTLTNAVMQIEAAEGSVLEHDRLQVEGPLSGHVSATFVSLGSGASFTSTSITLGGGLVRNNVRALFAGEGAECTLNGLSVAGGRQLVDNHTVIDHAVPRCTSHELYKAVLDGEARGVFNGKIFVRQDAQKTDAKQTNRTLLLSDGATIDTKPQLEIFADDVKCTHGATVGQLDDEQLFYLRARGIGEIQARDLLTFAFASDVINRVRDGALRERCDGLLRARLREGRVSTEA